jgi:hypothetical protein
MGARPGIGMAKFPVSVNPVSQDLGNVRAALDARMLHFGTDRLG